MDWQDYEKNMQRLADRFGKPISNKQHDIFYQRLKHIPAIPFKEIIEALIDDAKYFPAIKEIKERFVQFRSGNPNRFIGHERTLCLDCHGKGFLWVTQYIESNQTHVECCYRCGACENWKGHIHPSQMPAIMREKAERIGIKILPAYKADNEERIRPQHDYQKRVQEIGKEMPLVLQGSRKPTKM